VDRRGRWKELRAEKGGRGRGKLICVLALASVQRIHVVDLHYDNPTFELHPCDHISNERNFTRFILLFVISLAWNWTVEDVKDSEKVNHYFLSFPWNQVTSIFV